MTSILAGLRTRVQKPPRWIFNALGISSGEVPAELGTTIQPTADVVQGGWGSPSFQVPVLAYQQTVTVGLASTVLLNENLNQDGIRLWFGSARNDEAGAVSIVIKLFRENIEVDIMGVSLAGAGAAHTWGFIAGTAAPMRWLVCPPGWGIKCYHSAIVGAGVLWRMGVGIFPAGTKPF